MAATSSFGASLDLKDTFVVRQIRRCNRNLLLVNIGILATIVLVFGSQWKYFDNFFFGPFAMDRRGLRDVLAGYRARFDKAMSSSGR